MSYVEIFLYCYNAPRFCSLVYITNNRYMGNRSLVYLLHIHTQDMTIGELIWHRLVFRKPAYLSFSNQNICCTLFHYCLSRASSLLVIQGLENHLCTPLSDPRAGSPLHLEHQDKQELSLFPTSHSIFQLRN